jgi:hypothetical protein
VRRGWWRRGRLGTVCARGADQAATAGRSTSPLGSKCEAPAFCYLGSVKFTRYFEAIRRRPDRALIQDAWIQRATDSPIRQVIQADGRIKRWCQVLEMNNRYLRVILLPDGETVHNAFFDRGFAP